MSGIVTHTPPELEHDAMMLRRFGSKVTPDGRRERRIAWNLLAHLESLGWKADHIDDGEECTDTASAKDVMELLFNLDEALIEFVKGADAHRVSIILGNGVDLVSDWGYTHGDPDGFHAAMEAFDAEAFA